MNGIILLSLLGTTPTTSSTDILTTLQGFLGPLIGCLIAFFIIFSLSLVFWTFRDIRSRTQDFWSQILATALVLVFNVGGLFIYLILRPHQTLAEIYERQLEEESLLAEMTERQTCTNCHARVESDFQVCPSCGQKLKRSCPKCERLLELRWTYCPYCASNVGSAAMPGNVAGMPSSMQGVPPNGSLPGNPGLPVSGNRF
ncbi:zinc ribbon domain-containing protein [Ktedonobacteria bacterium brp13]|nr:zinc ribbon domain-containing protein [Ktedonobacteria bacterium brp13]